jgi:tetratricopeptide (TPR) repeat protein
MRIFVSHSSDDTAFCEALVTALRDAGADVWYDQHNLADGELLEVIPRELRSRPNFIVVLSKAAFASPYVRDECKWAVNLYNREPDRRILPVVAQPIASGDFDTMLYLEAFRRVEAPANRPYPLVEAITRTLDLLGLASRTGEDADPGVLVAQGDALNAQGRYQDAVPLFERVLRMQPDDFEALRGLGSAYLSTARYADAVQVCQRATRVRADSSVAWSRLAVALGYAKHQSEALEACDHALQLDPDSAHAWRTKAGILNHLGRNQEALAAIERALALDPQNAESWVLKGAILTFLHRQAESLVASDRATVIDANNHRAWGGKAHVLVGMRQWAAALENADKALSIAPNVGQYWFLRAAALMGLFRLHEALESLDKAQAHGLEPEFQSKAASARVSIMELLQAAQRKVGH